MSDGAHTSSNISLGDWIRGDDPTAKDVWRCSDALGVLLQRQQSLLSNRAMSTCLAMQHMPAAWLLIRQTHMSLGRIAAEDIGMEYMTSIAVLLYEFVNNRLQASSENVELVLFGVFERQTSGLAAAAIEMVRFSTLPKLGMHTHSNCLLPLVHSKMAMGNLPHGFEMHVPAQNACLMALLPPEAEFAGMGAGKEGNGGSADT